MNPPRITPPAPEQANESQQSVNPISPQHIKTELAQRALKISRCVC